MPVILCPAAKFNYPVLACCLQIINVDDNTVAFAQWGLGTMGASETPLPDTVVSKRSRHSNAPPSSAGKTPGGQRCVRTGAWLTMCGAINRMASCKQSMPSFPCFH